MEGVSLAAAFLPGIVILALFAVVVAYGWLADKRSGRTGEGSEFRKAA